jgi:isopentenyl phosphate kinase
MNHLVVIKLGGGLITDKSKPFTLRAEFIKLFAEELNNLRSNYKDTDFLVGNGAGSFGHFGAHEYGLRKGANNDRQYYGMCVTHNGVHKLNGIVASELTAVGLPAFALSPSALFMSSGGQVSSSHLGPVKYLLKNGCIPVLHGDTVCDTTQGTRIFSTEEVLLECIKELRTQYKVITVIYLLATDGVLDEKGNAISILGIQDEVFVHGDLKHDVTGGIVGKIASARKAAVLADKVYLVNGTASGELNKVLNGTNTGTRIQRAV